MDFGPGRNWWSLAMLRPAALRTRCATKALMGWSSTCCRTLQAASTSNGCTGTICHEADGSLRSGVSSPSRWLAEYSYSVAKVVMDIQEEPGEEGAEHAMIMDAGHRFLTVGWPEK